MPWNEEGWNKRRGLVHLKEFSFSRIRFRFHEWRRESRGLCCWPRGEREMSRVLRETLVTFTSPPLPPSSPSLYSRPPWTTLATRDLIAPSSSAPLLLLTARCSRSRFISRREGGGALIRHANVQRSALIKAIPARPLFLPGCRRGQRVRDEMGKGRNAFEIALCSSIVAFFPPFPKAFPSMGGRGRYLGERDFFGREFRWNVFLLTMY